MRRPSTVPFAGMGVATKPMAGLSDQARRRQPPLRYAADVLPDVKRQAMHAAVVLLLDDAFESLARNGDLSESMIAWYLPERLERHYTDVLYRGMLVAIANVGGQLAGTDAPALRCLADEMALHVIIEHAGVWLEDHGELDEGWGDYEDRVFEDVDFELLYDPAWDGIEDPDSDVARQEGMANLHPKDWFKPFRPDEPVHPYYADE
jgi:hypothetical protein